MTKSMVEANESRGIDEFNRFLKSVFLMKADIPVSDRILRTIQQKRVFETASNLPNAERISRSFFGRDDITVTIMQEHGSFHLIYLVKFDQRQYALRAHMPLLPYKAYHFFIERWISKLLASCDIFVPRVHHIDISRSQWELDYEISDFVLASGLRSLADSQSLHKDVTIDLGRTLAKIHAKHGRKFGPIDVSSILIDELPVGLWNDWKEFVLLNLEKHLSICEDICVIDKCDRKRISYLFARFSGLLDNVSSSILHGDLNDNNIFYDQKKIFAIIDWEDCLLGDPIYDIASWGTFFGNPKRLDLLIHGYKSIADIPNDFWQRYWLYFLRISLAKTVHRYRFGAKTPESNFGESRIHESLENLEKFS